MPLVPLLLLTASCLFHPITFSKINQGISLSLCMFLFLFLAYLPFTYLPKYLYTLDLSFFSHVVNSFNRTHITFTSCFISHKIYLCEITYK